MSRVLRSNDPGNLLPLLFHTAVIERVSLELDYLAGTYEDEGSYTAMINLQHVSITISDTSLSSVLHLALTCLDELTRPSGEAE